jgi:hypothetical protein
LLTKKVNNFKEATVGSFFFCLNLPSVFPVPNQFNLILSRSGGVPLNKNAHTYQEETFPVTSSEELQAARSKIPEGRKGKKGGEHGGIDTGGTPPKSVYGPS